VISSFVKRHPKAPAFCSACLPSRAPGRGITPLKERSFSKID